MMQSCCHRSRGLPCPPPGPAAAPLARCAGGLSSEDSEALSDSEPKAAAASRLPEGWPLLVAGRMGSSATRLLSPLSRRLRPRGPPTRAPCLKTPPSLFAASSSCARFTARLFVWDFSRWIKGLFCWTVSAYCGIGQRMFSRSSSSRMRRKSSQERCCSSTSWLSWSSSRKGTTSCFSASELAFNSFTEASIKIDLVWVDAVAKCLYNASNLARGMTFCGSRCPNSPTR
mmetsp:Transcript_149216/g.415892  ORF Transcript_149216/g.415892 Transcript_149216/m.415892 type:complete len:229 (-) Transcript_149216:1886-2572(-)